MRIFAFLFIYVATARAQSANLDFSRRLILAPNAKTLTKLTTEATELTISRSACRLQLRRHDLPYACYEVLRLEIRSGRHGKWTERKHLSTKLDELCEAAADRLKIFDADSDTSPRCKQAIQRAREILAYRRQSPEWSTN